MRCVPWDGTIEASVAGAWLYPTLEEAAAVHDLGYVLEDNPERVGLPAGENGASLLLLQINLHNVDATPFDGRDTFKIDAFDPRWTAGSQPSPNALATVQGPFNIDDPQDRNGFFLDQDCSATVTVGYWVPAGLELADIFLRPSGNVSRQGHVVVHLAEQPLPL